MVVYLYDRTFLYVGTHVPPVNPKRPTQTLAPSYSTEIEPPEGYAVELVPKFDVVLKTWSLVASPTKIAADVALAKEVEEAEALAVEAQRKLDVENTQKQDASGVYEYYVNVEGEVVAKTAEEIAEEIATKLAYETLQALKITMDTNIITKAAEITLGSTPASMQAFTSAFTLRASNPAEYVADGLQVHYATVGYVLGDALDTEVKITAYYTKILIELDKFRNAEIFTYLAAKAAL